MKQFKKIIQIAINYVQLGFSLIKKTTHFCLSKSYIRIIVIISSVLLLIGFIGILILPATLSTDTYLKWLNSHIPNQYQIRLMAADVHVQVFPNLSIQINDAAIISTNKPFKEQVIVKLPHVHAALSMSNILDGNFSLSPHCDNATFYYRTSRMSNNIIQALGWKQSNKQSKQSKQLIDIELNKITVTNASIVDSTIEDKNTDYVRISGLSGEMIAKKKATPSIKILKSKGKKTQFDIRLRGTMNDAHSSAFHISGELVHIAQQKSIFFNNGVMQLGKTALQIKSTFKQTKSLLTQHMQVKSNAWHSDILSFFGDLSKEPLLHDLTWDGAISGSLDITDNQSNYVVSTQLDLKKASLIVLPGLFKASNHPLRLAMKIHITPKKISIKQGEWNFGPDIITMTGYIGRQAHQQSYIEIKGNELHQNVWNTLGNKIAIIDGFDSLTGSLTYKGVLGQPLKKNTLALDMKINNLKLLGNDIHSLAIKCQSDDHAIICENVQGEIASGKLHGNGMILLQDSPRYQFDGQIKDVDTTHLSQLSKLLRGTANMRIHIIAKGNDAAMIYDTLKAAGTMTITSGSWSGLGLSQQLQDKALWNGIEKVAGGALGNESLLLSRINALTDNFNHLQSKFVLSGRSIEIEQLSMLASKYSVQTVSGTIKIKNNKWDQFKLNGQLSFHQTLSHQLITDLAAQRKLLDSAGRLIVPIHINGIVVPKIKVDSQGLSQRIYQYRGN